jgi:hypothetical protein
MRHAQVSTTMDVYGNALMESKREANSKVVGFRWRTGFVTSSQTRHRHRLAGCYCDTCGKVGNRRKHGGLRPSQI